MARKARKQVAQEDGKETREVILQVAQHLFMRYGYRFVSTRQLAEACGLTQPALYHYFADKQELYLAVVKEEIATIKGTLEHLAQRSDEPPELLKKVAAFLLSRVQYDLSLMLHDVRYELSPDARDSLDTLFRQGFIAPITVIFEAGIRQGYLLDEAHGGLSPMSLAYLFMTMLSRFTRQPQEEDSLQVRHTQQSAHAALIVRILFYGLASPDKR